MHHVGGFGADAEVGVGFGEGDDAGLVDDEDRGERKAPARFGGGLVGCAGVDEGDVDQDRLVVAAAFFMALELARLGARDGRG